MQLTLVSMTFDLKGGANVKVVHNTIPSRGTENGLFMIDTETHTLQMTNAAPLHDIGRDGVVIDWGDIKIMSLTEDYMQLAVLRDPVLSGKVPACSCTTSSAKNIATTGYLVMR